MLPYRLRAPIYGKKLKGLKEKSGNDVLEGGGPIQRAITQDLLRLRDDFVNTLNQEHDDNASENDPTSQQQEAAATYYRHVAPGKTFSAFRTNIFDSSKLSHLHTLVPPKCDREAYSQLIYACCLSMLKQAFTSQDAGVVMFEDASYALFLLYALFETNPLPRSFKKSSLELLPVGLLSKHLSRRSFAPNIRVDRYHYSLLLRLRMIALKRHAECQQSCMKAQEQNLEVANSDRSKSLCNWRCICSLCQDAVEIVDRIMPVLELCEYTGPVGLEGLAGHSEYPFASTSSKASKRWPTQKEAEPKELQPADVPPAQIATPQNLYLTDELRDMMNQYQSTIQSIPTLEEGTNKRGSSNAPNQTRNMLDPLLSPESKKSWEIIRDQLYLPNGEGENDIVAPIDLTNGDGQQEDLVPGNNSDSIKVGPTDEDNKSSQDMAADPSFDLVLPANIEPTMSEYLKDAVKALAKRGGGIRPTVHRDGEIFRDEARPTPAYDDVSSIGDSGISVATGRGRAALKALIASARNPGSRRVPQVAKIPTRAIMPSTSVEKFRATAFLDVDFQQPMDDTDDSSTSDLSLQDFGEDVSIVTDAIGRQALEGTIPMPRKSRKPKSTKKSSPKKRAKNVRTRIDRESDSAFTSIGQGRAALNALLQKVRVDDSENGVTESDARGGSSRVQVPESRANEGRSQRTSKGTRQKPPRTNHSVGEDQSATPSVGEGRAALNVLLSEANDQSSEKSSDNSKRKSTSVKATGCNAETGTRRRNTRSRTSADEGDQSVATSVGGGRAALSELLSSVRDHSAEESETASGRPNKLSKSRKTKLDSGKTRQTGRGTGKRRRTNNNDDGDHSVATSVGPGNAALNALLSSVRTGPSTRASRSRDSKR